MLAEYLVASALGAVDGVRTEWNGHDLELSDGFRIEVKSSAYVQSWPQRADSKIQFDIAPKLAWNANTNTSATERSRCADLFVFAVLKHRDRDTVDPLDVSQWDFYLVPTSKLDRLGHQKTIGLAGVRKLVDGPHEYHELRDALERLRRDDGSSHA